MADTTPTPTPDDGGAIGRGMTKLFGRSWRTTCAGLTTLAVGIVAVLPLPPHLAWIGQLARDAAPFVAGGGLMFAKDGRVSGQPK